MILVKHNYMKSKPKVHYSQSFVNLLILKYMPIYVCVRARTVFGEGRLEQTGIDR